MTTLLEVPQFQGVPPDPQLLRNGAQSSHGIDTATLMINGRAVRVVSPRCKPNNRRRQKVMHVHAGATRSNGCGDDPDEAILLASFGKFEVVSVEYRPSDHRTDAAALDDLVGIWTALAQDFGSSCLGLFGATNVGALTARFLNGDRQDTPRPGAVVVRAPWSDLMAKFIGRDARHAESPSFGNDWPRDRALSRQERKASGGIVQDDWSPTLVFASTGDAHLAQESRAVRSLRNAGFPIQIELFGEQSGGGPLGASELAEQVMEAVSFFDQHLDMGFPRRF